MFLGAAGRIAYSLIPLICDGSVFGKDRRISLRLIDIEMSMTKLQGIHHSRHASLSPSYKCNDRTGMGEMPDLFHPSYALMIYLLATIHMIDSMLYLIIKSHQSPLLPENNTMIISQ